MCQVTLRLIQIVLLLQKHVKKKNSASSFILVLTNLGFHTFHIYSFQLLYSATDFNSKLYSNQLETIITRVINLGTSVCCVEGFFLKLFDMLMN